MTRNFSNQRRDGMRPSSRNSAFGKDREEQSSRPARPRLSRDAVDRAWENGATRTYADYHPRQTPPTSPAQRQGRPAPAYDRYRQPQNRRSYEPSQENYGSSRPSSPAGDYQPRQYSEDRPRRFDKPGYRAPGGQPGLNSERWTRNSTQQPPESYQERYEDNRPPRFGSNPNYRGSQRPPRFPQDGSNPNYRGPQRPPRFPQDSADSHYHTSNRPPRFRQDGPGYRGTNQPRPFERNEREFTRGGAPGTRRDSYNPRWQSRPGPQRDYANQQRGYPAPWRETSETHPGRAQFEGDYERFSDFDPPAPAPQTQQPASEYERPVTRLPNGRVLKGSRPSQRRQAAFWNDVEDKTSELLSQVSAPPEHDEAPAEAEPAEPAPKAARPRKPGTSGVRKVKTVKTTRAEDAKPRTAKVARKNAQGPQKPVTRPSRRGYKWPASGE